MNRRQVIRTTVLSVIPLLLMGTGVVLSSAGPAGAGGTKHKAKLAHVGPDVEGLSKVSFHLQYGSGGSDRRFGHLERHPHQRPGDRERRLDGVAHPAHGRRVVREQHPTSGYGPPLCPTQNTTSGLFGATATGPIDHPANCATGQTAVVYGGDGRASGSPPP